MTALNLLAATALGLAIGGAAVASWRRADALVVSLIREDAICRAAERAEGDL